MSSANKSVDVFFLLNVTLRSIVYLVSFFLYVVEILNKNEKLNIKCIFYIIIRDFNLTFLSVTF